MAALQCVHPFSRCPTEGHLSCFPFGAIFSYYKHGLVSLFCWVKLCHSFFSWTVLLDFHLFCYSFYLFILRFMFRERGREGDREGEKYRCVREKSIGCLSHPPKSGLGPKPRQVPWLGIEPATFHRPALHPPSHTSEGIVTLFKELILSFTNLHFSFLFH